MVVCTRHCGSDGPWTGMCDACNTYLRQVGGKTVMIGHRKVVQKKRTLGAALGDHHIVRAARRELKTVIKRERGLISGHRKKIVV
jgi:hypothetical protein